MPYTAQVLTPSLLTSHPTIIPSIARLHASCILIDGTLATFIPPLDPNILTTWWQARYEETLRSERIILVIMTLASEPSLPTPTTPDPAINALPTLIVGVVTLSTPFSETGPFRGTVEKLLICPSHRRLGLARLLMGKLEAVAVGHGKNDPDVGDHAGDAGGGGVSEVGVEEGGGGGEEWDSSVEWGVGGEVLFWKDLNVHEMVLVGKGRRGKVDRWGFGDLGIGRCGERDARVWTWSMHGLPTALRVCQFGFEISEASWIELWRDPEKSSAESNGGGDE